MMNFPQEWDHLVALYWNTPILNINLLLILHILGALLCGILVGYERSYHGRAAGIRTYAIVCMASTAITFASGYPGAWFGAAFAEHAMADPTRVIQGVQQGILAGIGFLGAGVIMKEGWNITGLTTAASIWAMGIIGILIGIGFYGAGIALCLTIVFTMAFMSKIESFFPIKNSINVNIEFKHLNNDTLQDLTNQLRDVGYNIASMGTMSFDENKCTLHLTLEHHNKRHNISYDALGILLKERSDVDAVVLNIVRN